MERDGLHENIRHGGRSQCLRMERKNLRVLGLSILLVLVGIIYFTPLLHAEVGLYDEGLVLTGADLVLQGKIPYKDFYAVYAPGQYYLVGGLLGVFGKSVVVLRAYEILLRSLMALACFWLCRRAVPAPIAFLCFAAMLVWLNYVGSTGYPIYPFLLFAFLCLLVLAPSAEHGSRKGQACAGLLAGVAGLFRHDMGSLLIAALSVLLVALALRTGRQDRPAARAAFVSALLFLGAALLPLVLAFGALVLAGSGPDAWNQLVRLPFLLFTKYRGLPYPPVRALLNVRQESLQALAQHYWYIAPFFLFPLIVACSAAVGAKSFLSKRKLAGLDYRVIFLTGAGLACLPQAFGRSDFWHLIPLGMVSIVLSYVLVATRWSTPRRKLATALLLVCTGFWWIPIHNYRIPWGGTIAPLSAETAQVVSFLDTHHKGERIYVGAQNHDRMVVNAPVIYFLADVECGTKYYQLDPQIVATESVQMEIIRELADNDIRTVVLSKWHWEEPNRSSQDLGVDKLDVYIRSNYSLALDNELFGVWVQEPPRTDFNRPPLES